MIKNLETLETLQKSEKSIILYKHKMRQNIHGIENGALLDSSPCVFGLGLQALHTSLILGALLRPCNSHFRGVE